MVETVSVVCGRGYERGGGVLVSELSTALRSRAKAPAPRSPDGPPAVMSVTAETIASYQLEHRCGIGVDDAERMHHRRDRKRTREAPAQLGSSCRLDGIDQPVDLLLDQSLEARADRVEPESACKRIAVARMLLTVDRQHAAPDHLRGREARIVDGERPPGLERRARRDRDA